MVSLHNHKLRIKRVIEQKVFIIKKKMKYLKLKNKHFNWYLWLISKKKRSVIVLNKIWRHCTGNKYSYVITLFPMLSQTINHRKVDKSLRYLVVILKTQGMTISAITKEVCRSIKTK